MPSAPSRIHRKKTVTPKISTTSKLPSQSCSSTSVSRTPSPGKKRHNTLYDAVAGRITTEGLLQPVYRSLDHEVYDDVHDRSKSPHFRPSKYRDTLSRSTQSFTPDEALFQRQRAPTRIHEDDIYTAHRHLLRAPDEESQVAVGLNDDGGSRNVRRRGVRQLPQSDLLKSLHAYVSDFYATLAPTSPNEPYKEARRNAEEMDVVIGTRNKRKRNNADYHSFDETALLAMGILVEELAAEVLGETGDLVFVEGADVGQKVLPEGDPGSENAEQSKSTVPEMWMGSETMNGKYPSVIARNEPAVKSGQTRRGRKVRKLDHNRLKEKLGTESRRM